MNPIDQTTFFTRPQALGDLLNLDKSSAAVWKPEEMESLWHHQLNAPIESDLAGLPAAPSGGLRTTPETAPFLGKGFGYLLSHPQPPFHLLKLSKDFAKQVLKDAADAQFRQVAAALYYACYAAGMERCSMRVGALEDKELERGFGWALSQPWLDPETRALITSASNSLKNSTAAAK